MGSETAKEYPRYISEFIGTYVLVLTVGCNVLGGSGAFAALSIASALMIGIYNLGAVSGGHFNPAVTLAITAVNKMPGGWKSALGYMVVQTVGGLLAALTYVGIYGDNFNLQPGKGHTLMQAGIAEVLYTFMLCFVVLNVACASASRENQYYGLAIGFVIVAGGYAVGSISGGAFNPAVALGIDLSSISKGFGQSIPYIAAEFIGALLAAFFFRIVRAEDFGGEKNSLTAELTAEFIGTFLLTVTVGFNVLTGSPATALSAAAALMCAVYAVGNVSGAHVNPAVTFAILLSGRGKIDLKKALTYMLVQVLGGIAASLVWVATLNRSFHVAPAAKWGPAAVAEVLYTALLCFTVLSVATSKAPSKDMFGLAIGFVIVVAGFSIGGVSGAYLNPAVAIGADFGDLLKGGQFKNSIAYSMAQFLGAGVAAGAYAVVRPGEYEDEKALPAGKAK